MVEDHLNVRVHHGLQKARSFYPYNVSPRNPSLLLTRRIRALESQQKQDHSPRDHRYRLALLSLFPLGFLEKLLQQQVDEMRELSAEQLTIQLRIQELEAEILKINNALLLILTPNAMEISNNPDASIWDVISAGLWDIAKSIDPVLFTDFIEWASGLED